MLPALSTHVGYERLRSMLDSFESSPKKRSLQIVHLRSFLQASERLPDNLRLNFLLKLNELVPERLKDSEKAKEIVNQIDRLTSKSLH